MTLEQAKECAEKRLPVWYTDKHGERVEASAACASRDTALIEALERHKVVGLEEIEEA